MLSGILQRYSGFMLQDYERKVNIAAGAFLLAVAGMLALDQWNPTDANIWELVRAFDF